MVHYTKHKDIFPGLIIFVQISGFQCRGVEYRRHTGTFLISRVLTRVDDRLFLIVRGQRQYKVLKLKQVDLVRSERFEWWFLVWESGLGLWCRICLCFWIHRERKTTCYFESWTMNNKCSDGKCKNKIKWQPPLSDQVYFTNSIWLPTILQDVGKQKRIKKYPPNVDTTNCEFESLHFQSSGILITPEVLINNTITFWDFTGLMRTTSVQPVYPPIHTSLVQS